MKPGSAYAGLAVRDIPLRSYTGASILAMSRAGRVYFDPGPDFTIYPGDRVVVIGTPDELRQAEGLLDKMKDGEAADRDGQFTLSDIEVEGGSLIAGKTLLELRFRQNYGATVVGIQRGEEKITAPKPTEIIRAGDRLLIIGRVKSSGILRKCCSR